METVKSNFETQLEQIEKEENMNAIVQFKAVSWKKDNHGLFDYESTNISKLALKTYLHG